MSGPMIEMEVIDPAGFIAVLRAAQNAKSRPHGWSQSEWVMTCMTAGNTIDRIGQQLHAGIVVSAPMFEWGVVVGRVAALAMGSGEDSALRLRAINVFGHMQAAVERCAGTNELAALAMEEEKVRMELEKEERWKRGKMEELREIEERRRTILTAGQKE